MQAQKYVPRSRALLYIQRKIHQQVSVIFTLLTCMEFMALEILGELQARAGERSGIKFRNSSMDEVEDTFDAFLPMHLPRPLDREDFTLSMPVTALKTEQLKACDGSDSVVGTMSWPMAGRSSRSNSKESLQKRRDQFRRDSRPLVLDNLGDTGRRKKQPIHADCLGNNRRPKNWRHGN